MKILRVIRSLDPSGGGPAEGVRQITPHLSALGVSTTVVSLDPPDSPWLNDFAFKAIGLGPVFGIYGYQRGLVPKIKSLAQQHDVVIIEGLWQYHGLATRRALMGLNIPYFVHPHGMLDPWFKRTYPLKHLKKWTYWPWAEYQILRNATAVLFTTEKERFLARQSFWLYSANEIVVGYGTSVPPSNSEMQCNTFLHRFPQLKGKRFLLFLSRIHPKKGIDLLISAFAVVASNDPSLQLVIAGPDQVGLQAILQRKAVELGIADRIIWPGMLTGDLKWGAFRCAELFCLPSHQENFGIVVAEALACGLPVCISEPVNISNLVSSFGAGIVHMDSVSGTTDALRKWFSFSHEDRLLMRKRAKKLFYNHFDFSILASSLVSVLAPFVSQKRS